MSQPVQGKSDVVRITLDLWHPKCWTIKVTGRSEAGLMGHGVYTTSQGMAKGRFTVFGDTTSEVNGLIDDTKASKLTGNVMEVNKSWGYTNQVSSPPGNAVREIFVEFDPCNSIDEAFISRGFVYDGPTQIQDGREKWRLVANHDRGEVQVLLDEIREEMDAEITITRISSTEELQDRDEDSMDMLSARQQEVFELAQEQGYYEWPREVSAVDLAEEMGISKTTFLEHLRKAESKILKLVC